MKTNLNRARELAHKLVLGLLFVTCANGRVQADEPLANGWPVIDGAFTSATEYLHAIQTRDYWNAGWFYDQCQTNWHSTNSLTFFKFHAFDEASYSQLDLYDLNSFEFMWGDKLVTTWVFLKGDEYPDAWWLTLAGLGDYTSLDDDDGFLVRLNNDPTTDRRWHKGDPEPGQPGWDFTNYYGVFAYGDLNNSAFTNGYSLISEPRELYEWSITLHYQPSTPGGGGPPPPGGVIFPPGGGGGGTNPPVPPICFVGWSNVTVTNTVKDWKPKMGGWGTPGGIGFVPSNYPVMVVDMSKHPFIPAFPAAANFLDLGSLVTLPGNILSHAQPGQYLVLDDSPATPGRSMYDVEILQLDIRGGTLPPGIVIRDDIVLPSPGHTLKDPQPDGQFHIDSFFDIFTEISLDNGMSWFPATNGPARLNLGGGVPSNTFPVDWLFPNTGQYTSPESWHGLYAPGTVVSNLLFHGSGSSFPMPSPGLSQDYDLICEVELDLAMEPGMEFTHYSAQGLVRVTIRNVTVEPAPGVMHLEIPAPFEPSLFMVNATNDYELGGPGGLVGGARFIKQSSGALIVNTPNDFTGGALLAGGTVAIGNNSALGTGPLTLSHGTLQSADSQPRMIPNDLTLIGDPALGAPGTGPLHFVGPTANLGSGWQILTVNSPVTIANALTNAGGLIKAGPAPLTLSGENTFTGPTIVTEGPLHLADTGSLLHSTPIVVISALDVSQRADQTLSLSEGQTLAGDGEVTALKVLVNAGAALDPGTSIGTLTFPAGDVLLIPGSVTVMELDKATPTNDVIRLTSAAGALSYGGTLSLTNVSAIPLSAGDVFPLFSASQFLGSFHQFIPAIPAPGLAWDTSTLALDGTMRVATGLPTYPTNLTVVMLSTNALEVSWPGSHRGWKLQAQTNDLDIGLSTNWADVTDSIGTNRMFLPIVPANGAVFYRLAYP